MIFNYYPNRKISLIDYLKGFFVSKSKIYTLFLEEKIQINGQKANNRSMLYKNDVVSIILEEKIDYKPVYAPLDIVYEDDYLLIINKPKGIIIHDDDKNKTTSLCNIVAGYYHNKGYDINVRFAHRLDYDTTGIIIFCKDILTMSYMNHYISTHEVVREYRAFIKGKLKNNEGTINLPIASDRHIANKMRVSNTGKEAISHYKVIKNYKDYSLLSVILETGRTHQIRVHFSHIGHPLLGDTLYGGDKRLIDRVALHSFSVSFYHPILDENMYLKCELPNDMMGLGD